LLLFVVDFPDQLFLNCFRDPCVPRYASCPASTRRVNRLEHIGRYPQIDPVERAGRIITNEFHRHYHGAILAQDNKVLNMFLFVAWENPYPVGSQEELSPSVSPACRSYKAAE